MADQEVIELQSAREESSMAFLVYRPTKIRKEERTRHLRLAAWGLVILLCSVIFLVVFNQIMLAAQPSPETPDAGEEVFIDLDLDNPVELEDLKYLDDLYDIELTAPPLMDQVLPPTSPSPQEPTLPVLVYYRTAKTPSRLPTAPTNFTHLASSLPEPRPAHAPPVTIPDQASSAASLPPYHTPHVTLFSKIDNSFVAITPTTMYVSFHPATTTPTTPLTTTTTTIPSTTTTTVTPTTTTTVSATITVTIVPFVHTTVASPLNEEPVFPELLDPEEVPENDTDSSTEGDTDGDAIDDPCCNRGAVLVYILLTILIILLAVVVKEMVDLCEYMKRWSVTSV